MGPDSEEDPLREGVRTSGLGIPLKATAPLPIRSEALGEDGRVLVLVHGFGTNAYTWSRWAPDLSRNHRIHLVEMKGFGMASKPRDSRYGPRDQADLLYRWIVQNDLRDVTLIGHSLGGGVALLTALNAKAEESGRVGRLAILAGIAYPQPIPPALRVLARPVLGPLLLRLIPRRRIIRTALRMAYHSSSEVSESFVEAYSDPLRSADARSALSVAAAQLRPPEAEALVTDYRQLDLPSLLIWGRQDPVVPLWVGERLAEDLPNARLEILEKCGHMPQEELPQESMECLEDFLRRSF